MKLTVNKAQLVQALEEKRDEVRRPHLERLESARTDLDDLKNAPGSVKAWFIRVGELLTGEAHDVKVDEYGELVGKDVPKRPRTDKEREYQIQELEAQVKALEARSAAATPGYDSALALLGMADGDSVDIDGSDYDGLLAGRQKGAPEPAGQHQPDSASLTRQLQMQRQLIEERQRWEENYPYGSTGRKRGWLG